MLLINYKETEYYNSKDLALSVIGGRWKIPIIWHLLQESPLRLNQLEKRLPDINQRMLIRQLRELENDHIVHRKVYPVVPPKVEYSLTSIGKDLEAVVNGICDWGDEYLAFLKENHENE